MSLMSRVFAAVFSPLLLFFLYVIQSLLSDSAAFIKYDLSNLGWILYGAYLFTLPFFFFLGIPLSFLFDKLKGIRFINYFVSVMIFSLIFQVIRNYNEGQPYFELSTTIVYPLASVCYLLLLFIFEKIMGKLYIKYTKSD